MTMIKIGLSEVRKSQRIRLDRESEANHDLTVCWTSPVFRASNLPCKYLFGFHFLSKADSIVSPRLTVRHHPCCAFQTASSTMETETTRFPAFQGEQAPHSLNAAIHPPDCRWRLHNQEQSHLLKLVPA